MSRVLLCAMDVVIVETVGVGQSEVDVVRAVDTVGYVVQPGAGDVIQFLKAGVMEIPHLIVVNKADLGAVASRAARELESLFSSPDSAPIHRVSAVTGEGMEDLLSAIEARQNRLASRGELPALRDQQGFAWAVCGIQEEYGLRGIEFLGGEIRLKSVWEDGQNRFHSLAKWRSELEARWSASSR